MKEIKNKVSQEEWLISDTDFDLSKQEMYQWT